MQSCAYAPQTHQLEKQVPNLPESVELKQVPFFPQEEYQCGPAALATVINYRHKQVAPSQLVDKVYIPERKGSFQIEMMAAARQYGLVVYKMSPNMMSLLTEVSVGNPVVILQNQSFDAFPVWHYAVVMGYDLTDQSIVMRSGRTKRWVTSFSNFEQTWRKSKYWAIVITQPDVIPKTANVNEWLKSAYSLEQVGQVDVAKRAYLAATKKWPDKAGAWLSLTNIQYRLHQYREAQSVIEKILPGFRKVPDVWNNYAYILRANGCREAAVEAAKCGLSYESDNKNLQDTLAEMKMQNMATKDEQDCPVINCFH